MNLIQINGSIPRYSNNKKITKTRLVDRVGSIDLFIPHSGRETPRTYSSNI
jgi:hypothetical protein